MTAWISILICSALFLCSSALQAEISRESYGSLLHAEPKQGSEVLLVFIPGAKIKPEQYFDLARAMQAEADFPLAVAIPEFFGGFPNPLQVTGKVEKAIQSWKASLKSPAGGIFLAGHSLGGIMARDAAKKLGVQGFMLLGAYLPKSSIAGTDHLAKFPVPILTLSGKLDGLTGPHYIAREYAAAAELYRLDEKNKTRFPVVILDGVNHSQFADAYGAEYDGASPLTIIEAHARISSVLVDFMSVHTAAGNAVAGAELQALVERSGTYLEPLIQSREFDNDTCFLAQKMIAGVAEDDWNRWDVQVHEHSNIAVISSVRPRIQKKGDAITLHVQSKKYFEINLMDTSKGAWLAPQHTVCKSKTQESLVDALAVKAVTPEASCQDINARLIDQALALFHEDHRAEFLARQLKLTAGEDLVFSNGVMWFPEPLKFNKTDVGFQVRSPTLRTGLGAFDQFGGVKYCKLLPVSTIVEWMMYHSRI